MTAFYEQGFHTLLIFVIRKPHVQRGFFIDLSGSDIMANHMIHGIVMQGGNVVIKGNL